MNNLDRQLEAISSFIISATGIDAGDAWLKAQAANLAREVAVLPDDAFREVLEASQIPLISTSKNSFASTFGWSSSADFATHTTGPLVADSNPSSTSHSST